MCKCVWRVNSQFKDLPARATCMQFAMNQLKNYRLRQLASYLSIAPRGVSLSVLCEFLVLMNILALSLCFIFIFIVNLISGDLSKTNTASNTLTTSETLVRLRTKLQLNRIISQLYIYEFLLFFLCFNVQ